MGARRIVACTSCGQSRPNHGRGLCATCHKADSRKRETQEAFKSVAGEDVIAAASVVDSNTTRQVQANAHRVLFAAPDQLALIPRYGSRDMVLYVRTPHGTWLPLTGEKDKRRTELRALHFLLQSAKRDVLDALSDVPAHSLSTSADALLATLRTLDAMALDIDDIRWFDSSEIDQQPLGVYSLLDSVIRVDGSEIGICEPSEVEPWNVVERVTLRLTASQIERMLAHQYAPEEYTDAQWLEERHAPWWRWLPVVSVTVDRAAGCEQWP